MCARCSGQFDIDTTDIVSKDMMLQHIHVEVVDGKHSESDICSVAVVSL